MLIGWIAMAMAEDPLSVEASVHTLDNGLTVVLSEDHNTDTIVLHLHYGVGSRDEEAGQFGTAHLFEHLMFEGSANVPNNAFDEWLASAGGDNNAFTTEDETAYHMSFPSGALDLALMLESDRMAFLDAGLTKENLENQQGVVLQEMAEGYDEPRGRNWSALAISTWPGGHPYQHPVIGGTEDIKAYDVERVVKFWKNHYRPRNAVLGLVGNFDTEEALDRVEHWFSDVPDVGAATPTPEAEPVGSSVAGHHFITDKVEDRILYMTWPTVPLGHPDEAPLTVLGQILSGGRGTRLDDALQFKKSLASGVGAWQSGSEVAGQFHVVLVSDVTPLAKLKKKADKEMAKLHKVPPAADELKRAVKVREAGLADRLEVLEERVEVLVDCERLEGDPNCSSADLARFEAVTPEDVLRVFDTYLVADNLTTLSVVPEGDDGMLDGAAEVEIP